MGVIVRKRMAKVEYRRQDAFNLAVIALVALFIMVFIPPVRDFPIADDWAYLPAVSELLRGEYRLSDAAQPSRLGLIIWGVPFVLALGDSYTTLTIANLTLGLLGAVLFYLLARELEVEPGPALLGTAIFALNPIYVFLSYSFMTEIAFIVYVLGALLGFTKALRIMERESDQAAPRARGEMWWLVVGGVAATLAYLTRQFGVLVVPAALFVLWARRGWTWSRVLAISALPAVAVVAYTLWERSHGPRLVERVTQDLVGVILSQPFEYARDRAQRVASSLAGLGIYLLPLVTLSRRFRLLLLLFGLLLAAAIINLVMYGSFLPQNGNVLNDVGLHLYGYYAQPVWAAGVWVGLGVAGLLGFSILATTIAQRMGARSEGRSWREEVGDPAWMLYIFSAALAAISIFVTTQFFDRYLLPVLPALLMPVLRGLGKGTEEKGVTRLRWAVMAAVGLFSLLLMRDYMEHASTRWRVAEGLAAQGVPRNKIDVGLEWGGRYLYEEGARRIWQTGDFKYASSPPFAILDPEYVVSDIPLPGYDQVDAHPYRSWLNAGAERKVLVLKRR